MYEKYIKNEVTEKYNLICSIDSHEKQKSSCVDDGRSSSRKSIPFNSKKEAIYSLGVAFDFIYCWLK